MKTSPSALAILIAIAASAAPAAAPLQNLAPTADSKFQIKERRLNSRVWERVIREPTPLGRSVERKIAFTELATGACYRQADGTLADSSVQLAVLPDGSGAAALHGQSKAFLPADLAQGAITVTDLNGVTLKSRPLCLILDDGTNNVILAVASKSCPGQLLSQRDGMIWTNVFSEAGIQADVVARYKRSGVEVDLLLRSFDKDLLLLPERAGLSSQSCSLGLVTEFFDTADPLLEQPSAPGSTRSPRLRFGALRMAAGKAFPTGARAAVGKPAAVRQSWERVDDPASPDKPRTILIERVLLQQVASELRKLQASSSTTRPAADLLAQFVKRPSAARPLPSQRAPSKAKPASIELARAEPLPQTGFTIDYELNGSDSSLEMLGDGTYLLTGPYYVSGDVLVEGCATLKALDGVGAKISFGGHLTCKTGPYSPAVFSSSDDDSFNPIAETSSGSPATSGDVIYFEDDSPYNNEFRYLRFSYANCAVAGLNTVDSSSFWHCQFLRCNTAVDSAASLVGMYNNLIAQCGTALANCSAFRAEHLTVDQCNTLAMNLGPGSSSMVNSILSAVGEIDPSIADPNGWNYTSGAGVYTQVGGGAYYLCPEQPRHTAEVTGLNPRLLADLSQLTTDAPQVFVDTTITSDQSFTPWAERDAGKPTFGYHYPPLDVCFGGVEFSGTTITVAPGTALGWFRTSADWYHAGHGIHLADRSTVSFNGTVEQPAYWVRCNTVQEGGTLEWEGGYGPGGITGWAWPDVADAPAISMRFTRCSGLATDNAHFRDDYGYLLVAARDCEFRGTTVAGYIMGQTFTNCLFDRCVVGVYGGEAGLELTMQNCTQIGAYLQIDRWVANPGDPGLGFVPVTIRDCAFDGTSIVTQDAQWDNPDLTHYSYNAFRDGADLTVPSDPTDITVPEFNWQTSWLGDRYLPFGSPLLNSDPTPSDLLGLHHYTTQTDQTPEGTSPVDRGYHYVAVDNGTGAPVDSDSDGIPNYMEDTNGNGQLDAGETHWSLRIAQQPQSQSVTSGQNASFTVSTAGDAPVTYQWKKNGLNLVDDLRISGSGTDTLTISSTEEADAASYLVEIANSAGVLISEPALLTVEPWQEEAVAISGTKQDFTFRSDSTYYVSGPVTLVGTTTIEGGTVIKFSQQTDWLGTVRDPKLLLQGALELKTGPYRPAIFTAADDDSVGIKLSFSDGSPALHQYATTALDITSAGPVLLENLRVLYADTAFRFHGTLSAEVIDKVRHVQVRNCGTAFISEGTITYARVLDLGNVLLSSTVRAISGSHFRAQAVHLTADACQTLAVDIAAQNSPLTIINSVLANVASWGQGVSLAGNHNGFFPDAAPSWSTDSSQTAIDPFETLSGTAHYLKTDAQFRGLGAVISDTELLASLEKKSTQPPTPLDSGRQITEKLSLAPHVPRYSTTAPDLGYHYDVLDFTVSTLRSYGAITVEAGTAVAVRNETGYAYGFVLLQNSTFFSHGTPQKRNTFTTVRLVHEGPFTRGFAIAFNPAYNADFAANDYYDISPALSFRFCDFSFFPDDIQLFSGALTLPETYFAGNSSVYYSLRDCALHCGYVDLWPPYHIWSVSPPGGVSLINNLFDRVHASIYPCSAGFVTLDLPVEFRNNLMIGGRLGITPNPTSSGEWVFKDNFFDQVAFDTFLNRPFDSDYNAYRLVTGQLPEYCTTHLPWDPNDLDAMAPHDRLVTTTPDFRQGPFGAFYLPLNCSLYGQLNGAGSRSPAEAGLSQYTICLNQSKDSEQPAVSIGFHYIAAENGCPKDTDSDGVRDYVADADGNGIVDTNELSAPQTRLTRTTKANNDFLQVAKGSADNVLQVTSNDSDPWDFPLRLFFPASSTETVPTDHGRIRASADLSTLIYTPNANFQGVDSFSYAVANGFNRMSSAAVTVFVNQPGNLNPTAADHAVQLAVGQLSTPVELLTGCADPTSDTLTVQSPGVPQLGSVSSVQNPVTGLVTYSLDTSLAGPDTFTYAITDGNGGMGIGNVSASRTGNHGPTAVSYSTTAVRNQPLSLTLLASDADGTTPSFHIGQPRHGQVTGSGPQVIYTPENGFTGIDSFSFQAVDPAGLRSAPAFIFIKVQTGNNPPRAYTWSYIATVNTALTITLPAWDDDGDHLTYSITQQPLNGSLTGTGPQVTYTPANDFEGSDALAFSVTDGKADPASGVIWIKVTRRQFIQLAGPDEQDYTFRGNMTYYVTAPINLNGTTTIEGGAVIKYAYHEGINGAPKLVFNGPVTCLTSLYRPAVFTAADDDSIGAILPVSSGIPSDYVYADAAIELPGTSSSTLQYLRISYARTAVRLSGDITAPLSDAISHAQILNCNTAFEISGNSGVTPAVRRRAIIGNCLISGVQQPFQGSSADAEAQHVTVDNCPTLASDESEDFTLSAVNSIFTRVTALGATTTLAGDHNGFDTETPQFGSATFTDPDSPWPFAPRLDPATVQFSPANYHAAYYLRPGSPFAGVGTDLIHSGLKADLAQMTTTMPEVFMHDVISSQTLSPVIPRDTSINPSLGYHYPAVDYVLNGATVNNCTLNVDQGTVLAFALPWTYEWGLRLNPGARLNVNGVPTNRVVFARLEAIQEATDQPFFPDSPLITFKGLFLPSGTMVGPLPEARFYYADFAALAGLSVHLGPIVANQDQTYDSVATLSLNGCHFQAGGLLYEAGGPQARTLGITNNIFERCFVAVQNTHGVPAPYTETEEQLTAANNLFYDCDMWLRPISGNTWAFFDNLFDNSTFHADGTVSLNRNNGYVGMAGKHLSPTTETDSNPDVASLAYDTGSLGRFYLPATATGLLGQGSRSAAAAGLYHFTSLATNTRQGEAPKVNIGPAYLTLVRAGTPTLVNRSTETVSIKITSAPISDGSGDLELAPGDSTRISPNLYIYAWPQSTGGVPYGSGQIPGGASFHGTILWTGFNIDGGGFLFPETPADSNSDGIPDFIADRNGDGDDTDEIPWATENTGSLRILGLSPHPTLSGTVRLWVGISHPAQVQYVALTANGSQIPGFGALTYTLCGQPFIDLDTTYMPNGDSVIQLRAGRLDQAENAFGPYGLTIELSSTYQVTVQNPVSYASWHRLSGELGYSFRIGVAVSSLSSWQLDIFDAAFARSQDPQAIRTLTGTSSSDLSQLPWDLRDSAGTTRKDEAIFSTISVSGVSGTQTYLNKPTWLQPEYPFEGRWTIAYQDMFKHDSDELAPYGCMQQTLDYIVGLVNPVGFGAFFRTYDGTGLVPPRPAYYTPPYTGQTCPLRFFDKAHPAIETVTTAQQEEDKRLAEAMLCYPDSRNFFYLGHGSLKAINARSIPIDAQLLGMQIRHRYRFVFLFACQTVPEKGSGDLPWAFGIHETEPLPITAYDPPMFNDRPGVFLGYDIEIPVKSPHFYGLAQYGYDRIVSKEQAQFLSQFMLAWHPYGLGMRLEQAIEWAKDGLPNDGLIIGQMDPTTGNYSGEPYHAGQHLRILGYKDMKFNDHNQALAINPYP